MGLKDFWRRRPAQAKASAAGALFAWQGFVPARWTPRRYDRLAEEAYRRNVVAHRCVRAIATGAAGAPWLLYDAGGREFTRHKLLDLLARPNPLQGGAALFETLYSYLLIAGDAYLEAAGPDQGPPRELYALRPDRVKLVPGRTGLPAAYEYAVAGRKVTFAVDPLTGVSPILHLRSFNPLDDWYGQSALEAAAYAIDQHNAAGAWNQALLQNGARPSGALVYAPKEGPASLSDQQFARLKSEIEEHYSGGRNAGRPLLLEGGLEWKEMSLSPKDMDFAAGRAQSARDIACAFGVPPMLVGVPGDATYANYREARLALWEDTILPLLDGVADRLNNWLTPRFGAGLKLAYDADSLSALAPRREAVWARVQGADFLTQNEKRAAVGYGPTPGGDEPALKYSPDQPRAPAGSPDGCQWVDGGGGGGDGDAGEDDSGSVSTEIDIVSDLIVGDGRLDPANPVPPNPPTYKKDIVKQEDWDAFVGADTMQPGITPMKRYVDCEIFAAEGGLKDDVRKDEFGNEYVAASSGISKGYLDLLKAKPEFSDLADVKHPGELTVEQRARIYQWYFDKDVMANSKVGGSSALSQIEDKHSAAAFADVLFRGGGPVGAEMIQKATNETLKTIPEKERRDLGVPDRVEVDGVIGPGTFDTFKKLSNAGHGPMLRGELSDLRDKKWTLEGDIERNEHFRFRTKP